MTTNEPDVFVAAKQFLQSKGTTLWGRAYDVTENQSLDVAASWFITEMMGFAALLSAKRDAPDDNQLRLDVT
jgi:hypothetical protein